MNMIPDRVTLPPGRPTCQPDRLPWDFRCLQRHPSG